MPPPLPDMNLCTTIARDPLQRNILNFISYILKINISNYPFVKSCLSGISSDLSNVMVIFSIFLNLLVLYGVISCNSVILINF